MRKILFRGKRTDNGEWLEGSLYFDPDLGGAQIMGFEYWTSETGIERGEVMEPVDPETVGQFAGLTDKNGKKIFEGDCLRIFGETTGKEGDGVCVVHFGRFRDTDALADFDHLGFYITISTIPNDATTIYALEENGIAFEVIGNIHDNPELLEV